MSSILGKKSFVVSPFVVFSPFPVVCVCVCVRVCVGGWGGVGG